MNKHLIVVCGNDPQYLGRVFQLIEVIQSTGSSPVVLDLSHLNPKIGNAYQPIFLKILRTSSPTEKFHQALKRLDIELMYPQVECLKSEKETFNREIEQIHEACESAIISYARDANPNLKRRRFRKLYHELYSGALNSLSILNDVLERNEVTEIFIPNGRFPHQRAAITAATAAEVDINYYEKGDFSESIYLQKYSALDRIESQKDVAGFLEHYDKETVETIGKKWLEARMPSGKGKPLNAYVTNFEDPNSGRFEELFSKSEWIGIFTSSQDEFASLGNDWHLHEWSDQYSAISEVLECVGVNQPVYLRVHPNFASKSHRAYKRELKEINSLKKKHPNLHVFMHDDKVNSYELIRHSRHIVVWDSTIGLEAMILGKDVTELAASYYDEYTGVARCFSSKDLQGIFDREKAKTESKAIEFAAYLSLREIPLTASTRASIKAFDTPTGLRKKFLNLVSTGGNTSAWFAFIQICDTVRHSKVKNSIRHFSSWINVA